MRLIHLILLAAVPLVIATGVAVALAVGGPAALLRPAVWAALLGAVVVAAAVSLALSRNLAAALAELGQTARTIGEGDAAQRFRAGALHEVAELAQQLERMRQVFSGRSELSGEENARLATILQSMSEGVIAVDAQHRVLLANTACLRLMRLTTPQIIGRQLLEATRCRPLHDAVVQSLSRPVRLTCEFRVEGSPQRALLLRASQLPGEPCPGVVVVLHDVSELRRLENIRKEFVANVSHELKTPLASIKAYAETLRLGALYDADNNVQFVERIEEDADRLHQLITDMLQIARI
ncbi:MAG: PAS domain-containing protein, partial [Planctomycetales bacterium]|nr:PAS domain-containing protein [Planctomycetales bacterium]